MDPIALRQEPGLTHALVDLLRLRQDIEALREKVLILLQDLDELREKVRIAEDARIPALSSADS
jgi:hypothetical protein